MKPFYIFLAALTLILSVIVFIKYRKVTLAKSYNEVDSLEIMLQDVKSHLAPKSTIGFQTNTAQERDIDLYFKSAFILAPAVVKPGPGDTLLIIQDRHLPALSTDKYIHLKNGGNTKLTYSLLRIKN